MALRPIFLAALTALTPFLSAQTPPGAAPNPSVRVRTVISHPKTTGKTDVLNTPTITAASGSEARVTVAGKPDASGKVDNAMEMTVTPTVNGATGEITLAIHIVLNNKSETSAVSDKSDKKDKKRSKDGSPVAHEGLPLFHSALAADGLFSLEDAKGVRRWVPLRRTIDGWKLESYDKEKEILILTQGSARQELPLHKSVVSASATDINTVITVKSGEATKVGGMGGVEVTITADIVR